ATRYDGSFFGQRLRMGVEIVAEGVDPGLLGEEIPGFSEGEGALPVVLSPRLLEIYNGSFARSRGLPRLSEKLLVGFEFPVEFGRSLVGSSSAGRYPVSARIAGFSPQAMLEGITLPLETARRINARFGEDDRTYSAVVLRAEDPSRVPAIVERVRELGLEVDESERRLVRRVGAAIALATSMLSLLGLLVCALASANIALTLGASVRSRAVEFGIFRAVGARDRDLRALVLGEALAVGLVGGLLGVGLARLAAVAADAAVAAWLPPFPFQPETFFRFPLWLHLVGVGLGLLAALLGAVAPVRRVLRQDPARILA